MKNLYSRLARRGPTPLSRKCARLSHITRMVLHPRRGTTGRILEEEVLGRPSVHIDSSRHLSNEELMTIIRRRQPALCRIARKFGRFIAQALNVPDGEIDIYTAVNTPLDRRGIDGWVEYCGFVVTFDLTQNRQKEHGHKADFIIVMEHSDSDLRPAAQLIAERFESKRVQASIVEQRRVEQLVSKVAAACSIRSFSTVSSHSCHPVEV